MNANETRRMIKTADACPEHDEGNADKSFNNCAQWMEQLVCSEPTQRALALLDGSR
jgi:hypothetical protein